MGKSYDQQIKDLESGLSRLRNIVNDDKRPGYLKKRALKNIDIQEARIDFFKRGYRFRNNEIIEQNKLNLGTEK